MGYCATHAPLTQRWPAPQQAPQPQSEVPEGHSATQRPAVQVCPQPQPPGHPIDTHVPPAQVWPVAHDPAQRPPQPSDAPQAAPGAQ